jgi:hypothetical protein
MFRNNRTVFQFAHDFLLLRTCDCPHCGRITPKKTHDHRTIICSRRLFPLEIKSRQTWPSPSKRPTPRIMPFVYERVKFIVIRTVVSIFFITEVRGIGDDGDECMNKRCGIFPLFYLFPLFPLFSLHHKKTMRLTDTSKPEVDFLGEIPISLQKMCQEGFVRDECLQVKWIVESSREDAENFPVYIFHCVNQCRCVAIFMFDS